MVGESIAHYRIESLIGVGGMGEVYLARDDRLGRKVALKFLPERLMADKTQLSRFKSEARSASALNHPNILTVYEIGTEENRHFIATEFIEGVTLRAALARGRMSVHEALEVAVQVASALSAAHETGIVHRDIKPENIMLRRDGYVKVLDFGIAKLSEQQAQAADQEIGTTTVLQTHPGLLIGTVHYMSPEQIRGQRTDARSDIWSLGVVLYEMLRGVPPFSGATPSDCIASVLKAEPRTLASVVPGVGAELQSLVQKTLRKNSDDRYQTAEEVLADLRSVKGKLEQQTSAPKIAPAWLWTAAVATIVVVGLSTLFFARSRTLPFGVRAPSTSAAAVTAVSTPANIPKKSIAVLPFENRSRDPENAFFTDGVQDEILTDLARIADLKVISRTSVLQYKSGIARNLREIAQQLGVANVVEGSVQRAGNRVRVNAQLIDAHTDAHLWAQTYDRDLSDVFAIQSEIAKTIADQLQAKLSPSEKSAIEQPTTSDITAFDLYSHAKNLFLKAFAGTNARSDLLQAADLLKQAVARDPLFFQAYCQLAFTQINIYGVLDHNPAYLAEAEAALQSASRLRPDAGETHLARARNLYWGYLDYDGALRELEIARQSLPGEDWIFSLKGYIERRQGRWEECIRDLKRATELDPRNILTLQQLALTYQQLRRYAEEKRTFERILAFEPDDPITKSQHAFVELDSKADTRPLHRVTDSVLEENPAALPSIADNWLLCALAERDPAAARKALIALGENPASLAPIADVRFNRSFMEGVIARLAKDEAKAQASFTAARAEQEKSIQAQPDYGPTVCVLGLIDAALGRKQEALREGRRAVELLPVEKDAVRGMAMVKFLAMIAAWAGDKDIACEQLAIAVRNPSDLSYGQLKLMPFWDPLRGDPRFEALVQKVVGSKQK
jgi:non-specific serine/threonine protein kinase